MSTTSTITSQHRASHCRMIRMYPVMGLRVQLALFTINSCSHGKCESAETQTIHRSCLNPLPQKIHSIHDPEGNTRFEAVEQLTICTLYLFDNQLIQLMLMIWPLVAIAGTRRYATSKQTNPLLTLHSLTKGHWTI